MENKKIVCVQCNEIFAITYEEMEWILAKGFGLPKRCPDCRKKKNKMSPSSGDYGKSKGRKREHRRNREDDFDYSY